MRGAVALLDTLDPEVKATILRHEEARTTDDLEYATAVQEFYTRYVCRLDPWPDALVRSFDQMEADPTVYRDDERPERVHRYRAAVEWGIVDRLGEIDVPLLLVSGEFDEVRPDVVQVIDERAPNSQWSCSRAAATRRSSRRPTASSRRSRTSSSASRRPPRRRASRRTVAAGYVPPTW